MLAGSVGSVFVIQCAAGGLVTRKNPDGFGVQRLATPAAAPSEYAGLREVAGTA